MAHLQKLLGAPFVFGKGRAIRYNSNNSKGQQVKHPLPLFLFYPVSFQRQ